WRCSTIGRRRRKRCSGCCTRKTSIESGRGGEGGTVTGAIWQGKTLTYQVLYPDGHREGESYPVVFCLHGYGANRADLPGLAERLNSRGYLYVLPDGPIAAFDGADPTMRAWYERGGNESAAAVGEALAALEGLVGEVLERFRTPPGRA